MSAVMFHSFTRRDAQWLAVLLLTIGLWMLQASYSSLRLPQQQHQQGGISTNKGATTASNSLPESKSRQAAAATKKLRVVFRIMTADTEQEVEYRRRHRDLFTLWNDSRVCTLHSFRQLNDTQQHDSECELMYTFVMGRSFDMIISKTASSNSSYNYDDYVSLPTMRVHDDTQQQPLEVQTRPIDGVVGADININTQNDVTLLNIRENMNDGKSPSWLHFASSLTMSTSTSTAESSTSSQTSESPNLFDYIIKCDSDAILSLHDYFRFAYTTMPPFPYNHMTLIAAPIQKDPSASHWQNGKPQEAYYQEHYYSTHIYASGQLYIYSTDLARKVATEARQWSGQNINNCPYCAKFEDHDTGSMAFHTTGAFDATNMDRGGIDDGYNVPQQMQQQRDRSQGLYTQVAAAAAQTKTTTRDSLSTGSSTTTTVLNRNQPIRFVILGLHHFFWQHWVKQDDVLYRRIYDREQARMAGNTTYDGERIYLTPPDTPKLWEV